MTWIDARTAASRINSWGKHSGAFFFLISYDKSKCLVERVRDISDTELLR